MSKPEVPSIPFAKPNITAAEEEAVLRVLRSGWLTTGKETLAFEQEFSAMTGAAHSLAVNSATSGLHLALEALGISQGDFIAVSPYTFTASTEVMRYLGAHPLFVDIAPGSFHMDPAALERVLAGAQQGRGPMPKAIMPVHIGGVGWELDRIYELAAAYRIPVVEDAAHAFPARLAPNAPLRAAAIPAKGPAYLGQGGDIGVYSFYANKTITTGEGGMICCQDHSRTERMKIMRLHGIDREVWNRFTSNAQQWRYAVIEPGYKYNLTDIASAMGRVQLQRADELMNLRREIALAYNQALADIPGLQLPPKAETAAQSTNAHSWHLYSIKLSKSAPINRDDFIQKLQQQGIGTSVHYIPLHIMPYYQKQYDLQAQDFPQALAAWEDTVSLPMWAGLDKTQIDYTVSVIRKVLSC